MGLHLSLKLSFSSFGLALHAMCKRKKKSLIQSTLQLFYSIVWVVFKMFFSIKDKLVGSE